MDKFNWTAILIGILIIIYLSLFALLFTNERWSDGDEVHYLLISSSILKDGDLVLDNNYENKDYFTHHSNEEKPTAYKDKNDELRPPGGILTSIIVTPGYGLGILGNKIFGFSSNRFFLFFPRLTILIFHIFFSVILIKYLMALGFNKNLSILCVILYLIQLPVILYSLAIYPDLLSGYFVMAGILGVIIFSKNNNNKWLILSGIFFGLSIFLHSKLIVFTAILILSSLVYMHIIFKQKPLLNNASGMGRSINYMDWFKNGYYRKIIYSILGPWAVFLLSNVLMKFYWFGTFYFDGIAKETRRGGFLSLIANPLKGWLGQWLDIEVGLLPNAPLLTLIFIGLFIWYKKQKSSFLFIFPPTLLYLFVISSITFWHAGFCPPARYLQFAIPILLPSLCWILYLSQKIKWLRYVIAVPAFLSLLLSSLIPFVGRRGLPYFKDYNIYWRTILNFLRLDFLEPYISLNFFKPEISDYIFGTIIFLVLIGFGFYLKKYTLERNKIKK